MSYHGIEHYKPCVRIGDYKYMYQGCFIVWYTYITSIFYPAYAREVKRILQISRGFI